jgi:enoyl-CoA hydratase/carnithine racemase
MERILTFPSEQHNNLPDMHGVYSPLSVPTVAAINGHCFAGAFMFALTCDYRVMTDGSKRNAWMCMNEARISI